ncbi:hypothetical protein B7494_g6906 [Chlorociboria aeruginascens]|nr:hypothetical protein B7494_g6906 [Chlorociboria aeruginascens]
MRDRDKWRPPLDPRTWGGVDVTGRGSSGPTLPRRDSPASTHLQPDNTSSPSPSPSPSMAQQRSRGRPVIRPTSIDATSPAEPLRSPPPGHGGSALPWTTPSQDGMGDGRGRRREWVGVGVGVGVGVAVQRPAFLAVVVCWVVRGTAVKQRGLSAGPLSAAPHQAGSGVQRCTARFSEKPENTTVGPAVLATPTPPHPHLQKPRQPPKMPDLGGLPHHPLSLSGGAMLTASLPVDACAQRGVDQTGFSHQPQLGRPFVYGATSALLLSTFRACMNSPPPPPPPSFCLLPFVPEAPRLQRNDTILGLVVDALLHCITLVHIASIAQRQRRQSPGSEISVLTFPHFDQAPLLHFSESPQTERVYHVILPEHIIPTAKSFLRDLVRRSSNPQPPPPPNPRISLLHHPDSPAMAAEMDWSPDFCLACDRQTDGNVYCSEACRLAEYEKASGSPASSPTSPRGPLSWPSRTAKGTGFFMEPAYNFSNAQPYGTTPSPRTPLFYQPSRPRSSPVTFSKPVLTPSSSQSSLSSLQSTSSTSSEPSHLSDESRKALRAYASSFDQSRYSRRQSTN